MIETRRFKNVVIFVQTFNFLAHFVQIDISFELHLLYYGDNISMTVPMLELLNLCTLYSFQFVFN